VNHWIQSHLTAFLDNYGYWTVFFGILMESAGVPLPGETILIFAALFAGTTHKLSILDVALVAAIAAIVGDNMGFALGKFGGCPLLERYGHVFRIDKETIRKGEALFRRYGAAAVFFGRFIALLRFLAGPLAGILKMAWPRFLIFNALGAVAWVGVVTSLAYFLGPAIEPLLRHAGWVIIGLAVAAAIFYFVRRRRAGSESSEQAPTHKAA
jgi:membrane protein DedA with SNARE-associated domain